MPSARPAQALDHADDVAPEPGAAQQRALVQARVEVVVAHQRGPVGVDDRRLAAVQQVARRRPEGQEPRRPRVVAGELDQTLPDRRELGHVPAQRALGAARGRPVRRRGRRATPTSPASRARRRRPISRPAAIPTAPERSRQPPDGAAVPARVLRRVACSRESTRGRRDVNDPHRRRASNAARWCSVGAAFARPWSGCWIMYVAPVRCPSGHNAPRREGFRAVRGGIFPTCSPWR